ncbi:pimeloyl-ACP methyl ester carboxylesterase [Nocardia tenerifensis]|uniref:Pimeloyl-ACP methyl ester carboxylesterase n=1 Tax=Nocardia tenerifensis TaxID=228006 RepID=A0A318K0S3_9NOCA|nr:alpha/beta hydrolase [Nocardia tenerifensis]PXX63868.1 pimeloyl-ACP methyl ester carboxylesterase [Nocardia tenerifensis]
MPNFQTTDGTTLAYEVYGTGAPIVFVAGWSLHADMWEYQVPFFVERGYRCVMLDRRGHGRSDRPATGYDVDTRADDLAALLTHLDLTGITLVAHSAGGGEVVRYLARHGSERVDRLALLAAAVPMMRRTDDNPIGVPQEAWDATMHQLRTDRPKWFADRAQGYFATHLGNDVSPAIIDHEMQRCLSAAPFATIAVQEQSFHADHRADTAGITVPTLIVHGLADQSIPIDVSSRETAALVPNNVFKEYPTAGHGLYITHATQLNADLLEFIKG